MIGLHFIAYLHKTENEMASQAYDIRPPTPSDAAAISGVISASFSQTFGHALAPSDLARAIAGPLSPESLHAQLNDPASHFLIATSTLDEEARVAGVIHTSKAVPYPCLQLPEPVYLRKLYVDSAHHGTGLAGKLLAAAEDVATSEGYKSMWLGVWEHNARGMKFYEKAGFVKRGEKLTELGGGQKDVIMEKAL
jgi:ribosomal protein S18 acetylase RimI-like enzyme